MKKKNLTYYKTLEYNIVIEKEKDEDEQWFIAYANELGKHSCYGRGESREEAINSFLEEKEVFLEYLFNEGLEIPEPEKVPEDNYSGVFNVRTSPYIHAQLVYQAKQQGVSLNLYLNQILSGAVERNKIAGDIYDKLSALCLKVEALNVDAFNQFQYHQGKMSGKHPLPGPYLEYQQTG